MNSFSPILAIKYGWETFWKNPGFILGVFLLTILPVVFFGLMIAAVMPAPTIEQTNLGELETKFRDLFLFQIVFGIIALFLNIGVLKTILNFVETGKGNFNDILTPIKQPKLLINYLGAILIIMIGFVVFFLGTIFITFGIGIIFIVPLTWYLMLRLGFFPFYIIDKGSKPIEAFKTCWNDTKGNFLNILGLYVLIAVVSCLGGLALGVGLLVTTPVCMLATIYAYKMISSPKPTPQVASTETIHTPSSPPPTI